METRIINSLTEINISGGGNFITENYSTYFPTFATRRILRPGETIDRYREITASEKSQLEALAASWSRPPQVFIDLWNKACASYGRYNESTGYFELNGLTDITYEEAIDIYNFGTPFQCLDAFTYVGVGYNITVRTILPLTHKVNWTRVAHSCFHGSRSLEVLILSGCAILGSMVMTNLRVLICKDVRDNNCTSYLPSLEEFKYENSYSVTRCNKSFAMSSHLSFDSVENLVQREPNGPTSVTITVHPEVYAKLTDETNEEWHKVLTDAADKNINFATI